MDNKKTILIVDDDEFLSGALQIVMEEYGHVVSCCNNGLDAINLSKVQAFDMILTDYHMPGLTGDVVCRLIRNHRPDAYIVGFSSDSKDQAFINAGANKFIYKDMLAQDFSLLHQLVQMTP